MSDIDGVWIVQNFEDGRIVGVCEHLEEAEAVAEAFAPYSGDVRFARFTLGYRFGQVELTEPTP